MKCGVTLMGCAIAALSLFSLPGCGEEEQAEVLPAPAPTYAAPAPEYASAEALLEHCRSLLQEDPPRLAEFLDEFYYENSSQAMFQEYVERYLRPRTEFYNSLLEYFGEDSLLRKRMRDNRITIPSDARVNHSGPQRADSILVWITLNRPLECAMEMVEMNGRWWVSGYTVEPVMDDLVREDFFNDQANFHAWVRNSAPGIKEEYAELTRRVNRREFGNAYEVLALEIQMLANHGMEFYLR